MSQPTGIFTREELGTHVNCPELAKELMVLFKGDEDEPIIDLGCGTGYYLNYLQDQGFTNLRGIDGIKPDKRLFDNIEEMDLSQPIILDQRGHVISLEVGEHIPAEFEENYIDNITLNCDGMLVLSWAVEGQPGIGHVNCKNNDYIINEVTKRDFKYLKNISKALRDSITHNAQWFKNTLMVFTKENL